jgi:hypothetical protein
VFFQIHLYTIKNSFFCFNIHTHTFQIHYSTLQKPYILLTYITIPLLNSNILPYTFIYVETDMKPIYSALLCLVTKLLFEIVIAPHNSTKMSWHVYRSLYVSLEVFNSYLTNYGQMLIYGPFETLRVSPGGLGYRLAADTMKWTF